MKKHLIIPSVLVALIAFGGIGYALVGENESPPAKVKESSKLETFKDDKGRVSLSLPAGYEKVAINSIPGDNPKSSVILQLQRSYPQAFIIVRHDTGISTVTAMARQSTLEYLENTVRQFYPVRYGSSYKSESLERTKVDSREAIEHIYTYTDKDGNPNKVRLLAIIWSQDEVYNIIIQSHPANFENIKGDLDSVKMNFKVLE